MSSRRSEANTNVPIVSCRTRKALQLNKRYKTLWLLLSDALNHQPHRHYFIPGRILTFTTNYFHRSSASTLRTTSFGLYLLDRTYHVQRLYVLDFISSLFMFESCGRLSWFYSNIAKSPSTSTSPSSSHCHHHDVNSFHHFTEHYAVTQADVTAICKSTVLLVG